MRDLEARFLTLTILMVAGCAPAVGPHYDDISATLARHSNGAAAAAADGAKAAIPDGRLSASMSVDDVVAVVLANNATVRAALARVGIGAGQLRAAGSVSNPSIELHALAPLSGDRAFSLEVGLLQELNSIIARASRRAAARHELERTKLEVASAILEHASEARGAAYGYIASKRVLSLRRDAHRAATSSAEVSQRLFEAGNLGRLDVGRRELAREEARLAEQRAVQRLTTARERLTRLMSLTSEASSRWEITQELPPVPEDGAPTVAEFEQRAVETGLRLQAHRAGIAAAEDQVRSARVNAWPHLSIGAVADIEPAESSVGFGPAVELSLPIFSFGSGAIAAARAEVTSREAEYAQAIVGVQSGAREARASLDEAHARARLLETTILPLRREVLKETLKMYNGMYVGVFELLRAKQEEIETTAAWIEAVADYWTARAQFELALQGGRPAVMEAPPMAASPTPTSTESH